jgi:Tfp pilus assembly protein PilF
MRAVVKTELEDYDGARADLDDAYQIDTKLENLVTAVRGRINLLTKKDKEGKDQISRAVSAAPNDYRILAIAARAELDQGQYANARKLIATIQQAGVSIVELEIAQAWLNFGTANGDPVNSKLAMSCARDACLQSDFDDWLALGTLAATHAIVKEFDEAKKLMERVNQIAPLQRGSLVEEWTHQLENKEAWTTIVK